MCICIPNMKFPHLTLCQGEVCTDAADANDDDGQFMIVEGSLVDTPNEPKSSHLGVQFNMVYSQRQI